MTDTTTVSETPPPGWYDDPGGSDRLRWWGGLAWTEHLKDRVDTPVVPPRPRLPEYEPRIPEYVPRASPVFVPGSPNTVAVWLLVAFPLLAAGLALVAFFNITRPEIVLTTAVILIGMAIFLTIWDRLALHTENIRGPSLWWLLLAFPLVYLIVRAIKTAKVGARFVAPVFVYLVSSVAASAILVFVVLSFGQAMLGLVVVKALELRITEEWTRLSQTSFVADCPDDAPVWQPGTHLECTVHNEVIDGHVWATVTTPYQFEFGNPPKQRAQNPGL